MSQKYALDGLTKIQIENVRVDARKDKKPRKIWNWKRIILAIIIAIVVILVGLFFFLLKVPKDKNASMRDFEISKGQGAKTIAANLRNEQIIRSKYVFLIYVLASSKSKNLKEGTYQISASMNIPQIVNKISQEKPTEIKLTIIEGWRIEEIAAEVEKNKLATEEDFIEALSLPWDKEFDFLQDRSKEAGKMEGYLFPDTYFFTKDTTAEDIVRSMLKNFDHKLDEELREKIKEEKKTIFEAVTMASIIEREAKLDEDRPKIASVYYNRLNKNMRLEADPTVQYAKGSWAALVAGDYQRIDSLYNTYLNPGLPPGPICSPGLDSIKAAISPDQTNYFYFFHLKDGKTIYSETAEEHEARKKEYKINGER